MKRKLVVIVLLFVFFGTSCYSDTTYSGESGVVNETRGYYQDSLYDVCFRLDKLLSESNIDGIKALLVNDFQEAVEYDDLEEIIDFVHDESISINPYEVKNVTGLKRGKINNRTVLYSDIEYFDVLGQSSNKYHIWIQMCNTIENETNAEGINYIRITNITNDDYIVVSKIGYYYANNTYNDRD